MEGARHTRSKSTSSFEGQPQFQKHITVSRLSPDSGSYANASIRKDASLEVGQSSFGRAADRPLANLPAENVSKEPEPKRRTLSGFVRLLRRQGLPSLWSARKQKKKLSDSYQLKNTSNNIEPNQELYDGQSSRRSPKQQQECNDVYEDLEASSFVSGRYSSRWSASSMLSKSEMALIKQNLDSKRLTYDETISEKFLESEDLDVTSDMLDSRDILKKFGVKKKSSGNPVYDQQGTSSSSLGSPTALLNGNAKPKRADGDVTGKDDISHHPNRDDALLLDPHYRHRARTAHKMSDVQSKEKNKKCTLPAPVLALKPDLGKMKNDHGSSPYHSQDYMPNSSKRAGQPSAGSVKELAWRKTKSYYDAEFLDPFSDEARTEEAKRLAKKITRRLRDACEKNEDAQYSGIKEYVTDESVYGATESEIDKELDMLKVSSRSSFVDDNEWGSHASSRSVNKEAKKRLAERWKITPKYRDLEILGSSSTLGEMLSTPDGERRSRETASGHTDRSSKKLGSDHGSSISRGASKNKTERTSRLKSVPPISGRISGRGTCHDVLDNEKHLVQRSHDTDKVTKQCPSHKDHFSTQASKFYGKKPLPCPPIFIEEIDSSLEAMFEIQMEANVKDLPRQQLTFQMEDKDECSGGDDVSETVAAEHGISSLLSKTSLLHPNDSPVDNESSSSTAHDQKDSCLQEVYGEISEESDPSIQHLGAEPFSSDKSKDVDYASPIISVFETPLIEYASSSKDNSDRVSAELKDLRLQLQLLKMESKFYDNHIPFDKDTISSGGWEASYTLDLLILAGLHDFGFDLFRIMWHSPECPLDIRLFDILEETYRNEMAGSRPERMLLFDRINSALSVIFLKHVDVCPWEMSKLRGSLHLTWQKERARRTIEKLIAGLESANGMQATENILDREMQWSDPMEEVFSTGNAIGELLINDLINELLFD